MKKIIYIVIALLVSLIIYTTRYRVSLSNFYAKWLINTHIFSWDTITIPAYQNHTETVFYPLDTQVFKIQISGANVIWFFFVYDFLWKKEYKPSSSVQTLPWNIFEVNDSPDTFIQFHTQKGTYLLDFPLSRNNTNQEYSEKVLALLRRLGFTKISGGFKRKEFR